MILVYPSGQENRVGELNCNAGSHDRQFPFISTVDSFQKIVFALPQDLQIRKLSCLVEACCSLSATTVVVWTNLINLNESETWWSATDSMISSCTCPLTFSSGVFQGGRKGTHTTRYYEILRAHQQYAKDSYGSQNDLGLRCQRNQKQCSCLFGAMVQSGYFVGKCQWFNVGNCGQWKTTHGSGHRVNWCYFLFTKVVYGVQNRKTRRKFYFFVVSKSSQFRWENTLVSISGGSGIRPSCSSCLIKPNRMATRGTWSTLQ